MVMSSNKFSKQIEKGHVREVSLWGTFPRSLISPTILPHCFSSPPSLLSTKLLYHQHSSSHCLTMPEAVEACQPDSPPPAGPVPELCLMGSDSSVFWDYSFWKGGGTFQHRWLLSKHSRCLLFGKTAVQSFVGTKGPNPEVISVYLGCASGSGVPQGPRFLFKVANWCLPSHLILLSWKPWHDCNFVNYSTCEWYVELRALVPFQVYNIAHIRNKHEKRSKWDAK